MLTSTSRIIEGKAYQGHGDIIPGAVGWYGLRAYDRFAANTGAKCCDVIRASDSAIITVNLKKNGRPDTSALTDFLRGTTGKIVTLYNQSRGAGPDLTQGTDANRPAILIEGLNGLPAIQFSASTQQLAGSNTLVSSPWSMAAVAVRTGNFTTTQRIFGGYNGTVAYGLTWVNAADRLASPNCTLNGNTDNLWHSIQGVASTGANACYTEQVNVTAQAGTADNLAANRFTMGADVFNNTGLITGKILCAGVWPVAFSTEQTVVLQNNDRAYGLF